MMVSSILLWLKHERFKQYMGVGLRPQPDPAADVFFQRVFEIFLVIKITFDSFAFYHDLQHVPLFWGRWDILDFPKRGTPPVREGKQDKVVFKGVCPDGKILSVFPDVECDP